MVGGRLIWTFPQRSSTHLLSGLLGPPNASAESTPPCPNPTPQLPTATGSPVPIVRPAAPRRAASRVGPTRPTPNAAAVAAFASSSKLLLDSSWCWNGRRPLVRQSRGGRARDSGTFPSFNANSWRGMHAVRLATLTYRTHRETLHQYQPPGGIQCPQ